MNWNMINAAFMPVRSDIWASMAPWMSPLRRTAVVKDGRLHVQAGGGVVADSQPEAEWQETQSKARALLRAAEMAEAGLDTRLD